MKALPDFLQGFDNTMLSIFKECPKKFELSILEGYRSNGVASPLVFGNAWHKLVEEFESWGHEKIPFLDRLRRGVRLAFQLSSDGFGEDPKRTRVALLRSFVWYADQFRQDPIELVTLAGNRPGLELSFRFQLPINQKGTLTPFIYCGHIDKIGAFQGQNYVVERKTTTSYLNENYFDRYIFSSQVGGYVAAGKICFETPIHGAIIDSLQVAQNYSAFGRRIVSRVNSHLEEWLHDTCYYIEQVETAFQEGRWPHNTESCTKYGGCQFRDVCFAAPASRPSILKHKFHRDRWNPLAPRGE